MFETSKVRLNNLITRFRRVKVAPENLLLLLPHCLQWSDCPMNIVPDIDACKRCGKCRIANLVELKAKYGIQCAAASGGRQAVALVRSRDVKAVVAVACEKELAEGVLAAFPKPVFAVFNEQPCGYCNSTTVDPEAVEAAIRFFLK